MNHTHTPAEWLAAGSLGLSISAAAYIPYFLLADADARDFDPRPAIVRVVESGRVDPLLIAAANARFDARQFAADLRVFAHLSLRDAAVSVAALLALLFPATGGSR